MLEETEEASDAELPPPRAPLAPRLPDQSTVPLGRWAHGANRVQNLYPADY